MSTPDQPRKSILEQGQAQVTASLAPLADDEKAALAVTADNAGQRVGVAVELGKGWQAGGHVEKVTGTKGVGWFAGLVKRWKK